MLPHWTVAYTRKVSSGIDAWNDDEIYVVAIVVVPLLASVHRGDPRRGDVIFGDGGEGSRVQATPGATEVAVSPPLSGLDDLFANKVHELTFSAGKCGNTYTILVTSKHASNGQVRILQSEAA